MYDKINISDICKEQSKATTRTEGHRRSWKVMIGRKRSLRES